MATAQVTARLSADASDFKSKLSDAEMHAGKIAGGITKKFELKNVGQAMATALGLNLQSMSEAVARFATGMSTELEAAYGRVIDASDRARDAVIGNMRAQTSDENKSKLLMEEKARLQSYLDKGKANAADIEWKPSLVSRFRSTIFAGAGYDGGKSKREEEAAFNTEALDKYKTRIAQIETEQRGIDERRKKAAKEKADAMEAEAGAAWRNKIKQGTTDRLVNDELKSFFGPLDEISKKEREAANAAKDRADANVATTDEIVKQAEKLDEVKKQTIEITRIGREDSDLTDRELQRKVKNLRAGIDATSRSTIGDPNIGRYLNQPAELELARLKGEIDLRNKVRFSANRFGEDKAFQMFNLSEARFAEILRGQNENSEQTKLLRNLNEKLDKGIRVRSIATPGSQTVEE